MPDGYRAPAVLRGEFLLDSDVHFLNHGSFGACPRPVFDAYQQWQRELEREPVDFIARRGPGLLREAMAPLAALLGCPGDDAVWVTNATTGVNIVARSLDLAPGDVILATNHEYGACERAWLAVCAERGAELRRVRVETPYEDPAAVTAALRAGLDDRVRVIFASHVTSSTGLIFPVREICDLAAEAGALSVIDGAHAPGQIEVDLQALGADFYTGNCHKWLCGPKGAAFLYAAPAVQDLLEPVVVSWGGQRDYATGNRFIDELEYAGTRDYAAFLSVPDALDYQRSREWPRVRKASHALAAETRSRLLALPGIRAIHADDPALYGQMTAVALPDCDAAALSAALFRDYRVEVPIVHWDDAALLRVSIQGYNTDDDVAALLDALRRELPG